ncbi:excalibur calcium-binding domain-containing protein [Streptomyces sp. NPDC090022]|uniref:excalibur calcium-binding domain-containing protein n=1 Tax=Streptomyces sp. NPDC090022 TaxID=3365920 RepID=UPI0038122AC0
MAVVGAVVLLGAGCGGGTEKGSGTTGSDKVAAVPSAPTAPVMPQVVGQGFTDASAAVNKLGVAVTLEPRSAYADVRLPADHAAWTVCFQTPAAGTEVTPGGRVELSLTAPGTPCPEQAGATLKPGKGPSTPPPAKAPSGAASKAPSKAPAPAPSTKVPDAPKTTGGGGGSVSYRNCAEAKAAGAAPIRRGQPGYGKHLDRDNDGIACDK